MYKEDEILFLKDSGKCLEVRNEIKNNDPNTNSALIRLSDFFKNNVNLDLNRITVLQLTNCDISELPTGIENLNLKQLILGHNKLKEIPTCLYSGLKSLEFLDLSHNDIRNFDVEPACSGSIVTLKINNNQLHNFPYWVLTIRCPKLVEIVYSNNYMKTLKTSHKLHFRRLEMCNCYLLDVDFDFFKNITTLEYLNIGNNDKYCTYNRFKDLEKLFAKNKWKFLKVLNFNNLSLGIIPNGIFWTTTLTELYLVNCDLSWIAEDVQYLTNLETLDVSKNSICSLPPQLEVLENLKVIKAPHNYISSVSNLTQLKLLDLYNNCLDSVPDCVGAIELVDLENNCFNAELYHNNYKISRDKLRTFIGETDRIIGPKDIDSELTDSDESSDRRSLLTDQVTDFSDSTNKSVCDNYGVIDYDMDMERWDSEPINKKSLPKNPEVTSSDDEWDGKMYKKECPVIRNYVQYDPDEDWIFSDVD